jgi:localization factor PodJL
MIASRTMARPNQPQRLALLLATAALLAGFAVAAPARGDYYDGLTAYQRLDYPTAIAELGPLAQAGDPRSQKLVGFMYRDGQGVPQDFVQAHVWLNLAAASGDSEAAAARDELTQRMDRGQIAEAQRLAASWQPGSASAPTAAPIASTASASSVPPLTPAVGAPPLDSSQLHDLQWQLALHGYDPGSPDGVAGPRTRAAVRQYQADAGLPVDGEPTTAILNHLQYTTPPVLNPRPAETVQVASGPEPVYGDNGYAGYGNGGYGAASYGYEGGYRDPYADYDVQADLVSVPPSADMMRIYVLTVQQALAAKGYDPGPADGILGPRTREAIRRYQRGYNLPVTGKVSLALVNHLRLVSSYPTGYGPTAAQPYEAYPPPGQGYY